MTFFLLGKNPPSINTDEAAIGYNAFSILKTGRDEYGEFLPIAFRSFDDYKPPLYIYLTVPSVAIFGLNEFSVRFPSALLGVLSVIFTYLIVKEIFHKEKVALMASLILAISPWHLFFTRTAYETGSMAFFSSAGTYFFLKGRKNSWYFLASAVFFGLSPFLYQAAKVFTPLLLGALITLYLLPTKLSLIKKSLIIVLFTLILIPSFFSLILPQGSARFRGLSIFSDPLTQTLDVQQKQVDWLQNDNKSTLLFHGTQSAYLREAMINYLKNFRLDFLFFDANETRLAYIPNQGLLYLFELPLLIIGLYCLWRFENKKGALFILFWLLISPIPASVVSGNPNSIRLSIIMPAIDIVIAIGFCALIRSKFIKRYIFILSIPLVLFSIYNIAYFEHVLFTHAPVENSKSWYYSYKQVALESAKLAPQYDQIIVSNKMDQPYIFYLFYLQSDPARYLTKDGGTVSGGFNSNENMFDKYKFRFIDWDKMSKEKNTLFIGLPNEFPGDVTPIKRFHYLNGQESVLFVSK